MDRGDDWLSAVPDPQRSVARQARALVNAAMPAGYVETLAPGMATWSVPLTRYPDTYNRQPLAYVALAARRTGCALYLTGVYQDPAADARLRAAYLRAGKKIDLGRSCLRFRRLEDLLAEAVSREIAGLTVEAFIAAHERSRTADQD